MKPQLGFVSAERPSDDSRARELVPRDTTFHPRLYRYVIRAYIDVNPMPFHPDKTYRDHTERFMCGHHEHFWIFNSPDTPDGRRRQLLTELIRRSFLPLEVADGLVTDSSIEALADAILPHLAV